MTVGVGVGPAYNSLSLSLYLYLFPRVPVALSCKHNIKLKGASVFISPAELFMAKKAREGAKQETN